MHKLSIPSELVERVTKRAGRPHPFDTIDPAKTALLIIDMQNYFMKPGFMGEVPHARSIVPNVNRMAAALRERGGHVVWIRNATNGTRESWSVMHDHLMTPESRDLRYATMDIGHEGHALWPELDVRPQDGQITTEVDVSAFLDEKRAAFHAHVSQYEPDSPFSTIAAQIFESTLGTERFILSRGTLGEPRPERSLFSGL